jgi:hypothetical protein
MRSQHRSSRLAPPPLSGSPPKFKMKSALLSLVAVYLYAKEGNSVECWLAVCCSSKLEFIYMIFPYIYHVLPPCPLYLLLLDFRTFRPISSGLRRIIGQQDFPIPLQTSVGAEVLT